MADQPIGNRPLKVARDFGRMLANIADGTLRVRRRDVGEIVQHMQAAATLALAEEQRTANEIAHRSHLLCVRLLSVAQGEDPEGPLMRHIDLESEELGVRIRRALELAPLPLEADDRA